MGRQLFPVMKYRSDPKSQPECWGYIDRTGQIAIDYRFESGGPFCGGLARVQLNGKPTYIDESGATVLKDQYDGINNPSEGRGLVRRGEKLGYVDGNGILVIQLRYDHGREFSEGLAAVCEKDKWGYVDTFGKERISPRFAEAQEFSQGLAAVKIEEKWGYIDLSGDLVIDPRFKYARSFSEGLAAVQVDRKFGYVDAEGSIRIEPQFDYAREFREGLATVGKTRRPWSGEDCHFIDPSGQKAFELEFYSHLGASFSEGLVGVPHGAGRFAYFDKTGAEKISDARFTGKDGKHSYSQPMKWGGLFQSGIAQVMLKPSYYQEIGEFRWDDMAYIDKKGEVVWGAPR